MSLTFSCESFLALWSNNLRDTDKVLGMFFQACAAAGPELCALHESSASKIKERFMNILAFLKTSPMAVTDGPLSSPVEYGTVDYSVALQVAFAFTYDPYPNRPGTIAATELASAFAALEKGNPVPLWRLQKTDMVEFNCRCGQKPKPPASFNVDATAAISCTDGEPVEDTVEELKKYWETILEDSMLGVFWDLRARCSYVYAPLALLVSN